MKKRKCARWDCDRKAKDKGKWCSETCRVTHGKRLRRGLQPQQFLPRKCTGECGKYFKPVRSFQKFCSFECAIKLRCSKAKLATKEARRKQRRCAAKGCLVDFSPTCRNSRIYCSLVCARREGSRKQRIKNPEKNKVSQRRWVRENPEKVKVKAKRYRDKYPEKSKMRFSNWKAKKNASLVTMGFLGSQQSLLQETSE